jgi:hypothetical protein
MSNIAEQINILIEVQSVEREILQAGRQLDALHDEAGSHWIRRRPHERPWWRMKKWLWMI